MPKEESVLFLYRIITKYRLMVMVGVACVLLLIMLFFFQRHMMLQREQQRERIDQLLSILDVQQARFQQTRADLGKHKTTQSIAADEITSLKAQLKAYEGESRRLKSELQKNTQLSSEERERLAKALKKISFTTNDLGTKLEDAQKNNNKYKKMVVELRGQLDGYEEDLSVSREEVVALMEKLRGRDSAVKRREKQYEDLIKERSKLMRTIQQLEEETTKLNTRLTQARDACFVYESEQIQEQIQIQELVN